jgi:hypothetical protein
MAGTDAEMDDAPNNPPAGNSPDMVRVLISPIGEAQAAATQPATPQGHGILNADSGMQSPRNAPAYALPAGLNIDDAVRALRVLSQLGLMAPAATRAPQEVSQTHAPPEQGNGANTGAGVPVGGAIAPAAATPTPVATDASLEATLDRLVAARLAQVSPPKAPTIKIPQPALYGDKCQVSGRSAKAFLAQAHRWLSHHNVQMGAAALEYFQALLDGKVSEAFTLTVQRWREADGLPASETPTRSWEEVCTAFKEVVGQQQPEEESALDQLILFKVQQKPSQTVAQFHADFLQHVARCNVKLEASLLVRYFTHGLLPAYRNECLTNPVTQVAYTSLSEVLARAQAIERRSLVSVPVTTGRSSMQTKTVGVKRPAESSDAGPSNKKTNKKEPIPLPCDYCDTVMMSDLLKAHIGDKGSGGCGDRANWKPTTEGASRKAARTAARGSNPHPKPKPPFRGKSKGRSN